MLENYEFSTNFWLRFLGSVHYLETGDESYLNYVIEDEVRNRIPQDASLEFKEKWKKIYEFNKEKNTESRIKIIGTDKAFYFNITHLAHLAPTEKTGIALIDSLHLFKDLPEYKGIAIWSGKNFHKSGRLHSISPFYPKL